MVTSLNRQCLTTDEGICKGFLDYFQKLFEVPRLRFAQFDNYFANFSSLEVMAMVGCERHITEDKIQQVLKEVGADKTPNIDNLLYKMNLWP